MKNSTLEFQKHYLQLVQFCQGIFSYDIIRYIEDIPNKCKDDLKIPDARLLRPRTLIIHDNVKKKIFYIINCFGDEKIHNYESKYRLIKKEIENLIFLANYQSIFTNTKKESKIQIKSNIF